MIRRQATLKAKHLLTMTMVFAVLLFITFGGLRNARIAQAGNTPPAAALLPPPASQHNELPLRASDLGLDQRYMTFSHEAGIQGEGKDISALRHVSDNDWSRFWFDGADSKVLDNYVDYGRPFYAMKAGTVIACWRNAHENTPGSFHPDFVAGKMPLGGNHFWILQDDGVFVLYAHAKRSSIPTSLCPHNATKLTTSADLTVSPYVKSDAAVTNGAHVKAGQFLGRIGNSGRSEKAPHLHIHMEKNDMPVVMKFDHGLTVSFVDDVASFDGPWKRLAGKALPNGPILIWPPRPTGTYTFHSPGHEFEGLYLHLSDSGEMPKWVSCKSDGESYDSKWIPSKGVWQMLFGMPELVAAANQLTFAAGGYQRISSFTCGSVSVAVWRK